MRHPVTGVPVTARCTAALVGQLADVIALIWPPEPDGEKHDDEAQNHYCCQADHDLGHRILSSMA